MNTHMLQRQQKRDVHTREGRLCRLAVAEVTTTLNTKTKEKPKPQHKKNLHKFIRTTAPLLYETQPNHCSTTTKQQTYKKTMSQ